MLFNQLKRFNNTLIICWMTSATFFSATAIWAQEKASESQASAEKKSSAELSNSKKEKPYSKQLIRQQLLATKIKQHKVIWLDTSIGKWLSLYHQDETGKRKGVLIIVPDENLTITQSATLNKLSLTVPQTGWSSYVVAMPHQETNAIIKNGQKENIKKQQTYAQLKIEILQDVIQQVPTRDQSSIFVLLHGNNFQLFNKAVLDNIQGIILLNLIDIKEQRLADTFSELKLPILEIAGNKINHLPLAVLKLRKSVAKSSNINYRQIIYPTADLNFSHLELILSRTISGWLNKLDKDSN